MSPRLLQLVAENPRGERLRGEVASHDRARTSSEIETVRLDVLSEMLAVACVLCFQVRRSTDERVSSMFENDYFTAAVLSLETLRGPEMRSRQSPEQIEALGLIEKLLGGVVAKPERLLLTVKRSLTAACFLASALFNEHRGRALAWNMQAGVFICDELYEPVRTSTTLREVVDAVRARLPALA